MHRNKGYLFINRLGMAGLVLAAFLAIFSIAMTIIVKETATKASNAIVMANLYLQTRVAISDEELMLHEYYLTPEPGDWEQYTAEAAPTQRLLQQIAWQRDAQDQAFIKSMFTQYTRYQIAVTQLHIAMGYGNRVRAHMLHETQVDVALEWMLQQLQIEGGKRNAEAVQALANFNHVQNIAVGATSVVCIAGFMLFYFLKRTLSSYQQRIEDAMQAELARLEQDTRIDNLTNLGNHRAYQEEIRRLLTHKDGSEELICIALTNIDEMQVMNKEHGHLFGDHILTSFADLLRTVSNQGGSVYRLGGDVFALLLPKTPLSQAYTILEHLREEAQSLLSGATVSIGFACTHPPVVNGEATSDAETLYAEADAALQEAKRRGRNTVVEFGEVHMKTSLFLPKQVLALRRLLEEKHMSVVFQPIWDLKSGKILSFEALSRPSSEYGFAGPQEAFDIAEKIGRAHELDYVCIQAILQRVAILPANALLFLNLSPQTLDHNLLTGAILLQTVIAAGLAPERVVLELTERSMARLPFVIQEAHNLRRLGFRLALDDTGAGNAGLEMLSQLPVDFVKIDCSLVKQAVNDKTARGVLTGIKTIAQEVGMYVIAEGIENKEMLTLVHELGIQGAQGYLLGRPSATLPGTDHSQLLDTLAGVSVSQSTISITTG